MRKVKDSSFRIILSRRFALIALRKSSADSESEAPEAVVRSPRGDAPEEAEGAVSGEGFRAHATDTKEHDGMHLTATETEPCGLDIDLSDDGWWCIEDDGRPGYNLCGSERSDSPYIPYDEVPDEQTCEECLRVEALGPIRRLLHRLSRKLF
jgi:hypothetical protein